MQLQSVSVLMGAVTESACLKKTVEDILSLPQQTRIKEILIAYPKERVTPACKAVLESFENDCTHSAVNIRVIAQKTPRLGFFSDLIEIAGGTHCVFFPSDGAMPVSLIKRMVALEKRHPTAIVSSSRWLKKGSFTDYNRLKLTLNKLSQKYLRVLYHTRLTDLTNAVQIAPTRLMQRIRWEETGFSRGMEMVLKPLRLGVKIMEVPTDYAERTEGQSSNSAAELCAYFTTSLRIRCMRKADLLKPKK